MANKPITIDAAIANRQLLGAGLGDLSTWLTWRAVLKAAYARPLTRAERAAFDVVAGGRSPPRRKVKELVVAVSRRAGKGRISGLVAAYEAALVHHHLAPGERGYVGCISPTRAQSEIVKNYALGVFQASPILSAELDDVTADEIRLRNGNVIATLAADYKSLRGRTLLLAVLDEAAFLRSEGTATDVETARALLPGLATTGGILMTLSSPYSRGGLLFERHRDYFGVDDDDVLVVAGASAIFNPTLDEAAIAAARVADPEGAASEWFGEFRRDLSALFDGETIEAATDRGRPLELPPQAGVKYFAHCDAAGGAGAGDSFAISIGHKAPDGRLIVDLVRGEVGRFNPADVVKRYAALLREYRVGSIVGDHFAAGWVDAAFAECGIAYRRAEANASENYLYVVSLFTTGRVRLPDHGRLLRELRQLERHAHRGGRETVDHPRLGSDDFANVAAGVLRTLATAPPALWNQGDLLGDRVAMVRADAVYGVVMAGERGVAVVFFAYREIISPKLIVLDYELISPARFGGVVARLIELGRELGAIPALLTSSLLADQFRRLGQNPAVVDGVAKDPTLAIAAAMHIGTGAVKLGDLARLRAQTLPLGILDGTSTDDDDPLRLAALVGIAVGLDRQRRAA